MSESQNSAPAPEEKSELKDKAKAAYEAASAKADALYNKLPLDAINEKLASKGIKVDVKSRKFKMILGGVVAVIVVLLLCLIFCGGKPSLSNAQIKEVEKKCSRRYKTEVKVSNASYERTVTMHTVDYHIFRVDIEKDGDSEERYVMLNGKTNEIEGGAMTEKEYEELGESMAFGSGY